MPTPNRSSPFFDAVVNIVNRLNHVLGRDPGDGFVRVTILPNPDVAPFRAENGVHLLIYPPEPFSNSGGTRYGMRVTRTVLALVKSECLLDLAGTDLEAARAHVTLEDQVIDAVVNCHPDLTGPEKIQGGQINVKWKPGGAQMARDLKTDPGLVGSALAFEVTYAQPFTTV